MTWYHAISSTSHYQQSGLSSIMAYGLGHETAAALLPGFAINW